MKENEYIKVTNRVYVSNALSILRNCIGGDDYGISEKELSDVEGKLREMEIKLFASHKVENEDV